MNKLDLTVALKKETELTKSDAAAVVDLFFNEMADALAEGNWGKIRGYGMKFKVYAGRNPKTGEPTKLKAKKPPFFKCGKELKGETRCLQRGNPINREKFIKSRSL